MLWCSVNTSYQHHHQKHRCGKCVRSSSASGGGSGNSKNIRQQHNTLNDHNMSVMMWNTCANASLWEVLLWSCSVALLRLSFHPSSAHPHHHEMIYCILICSDICLYANERLQNLFLWPRPRTWTPIKEWLVVTEAIHSSFWLWSK